ncbi:LysR family transcriptional regulator [Actinomadura parmotrematis]|uniref:LysR family transcriptional regulator n=1 Tax=Actinomadura parmotrematis TaxID=2864039 RepID=A0ABS7FUF8_9ACTN|nr:LysR family transcriptional regulator [Actinomadura parmotrematis]MBW8484038.1 LysR family transcriptional regulator [Actinomadura parmotrematis]
MDLTTVRWFLAVADVGHVTNAAADLGVSQPALSRAIARLEDDLGHPLLDRAGRGVALSPYGRLFREHAARLVAVEDAARRALGQAADPERGEVSLAFLHTQGPSFVPDLIRRFRAGRPGVRFRLAQDRAGRVGAAVREGRADLGITSPRPDDPALEWAPLVTERLQLVVPAAHRLAGRRRVRLADVAGEPFVAFRRDAGLRRIFDELCAAAGVRPLIAFEGEETATVRGLVAAGLGVAVAPPPPPGEEDLHGVRHLALTAPSAARTIGLAWAAGRTRPPAAEAFRRFVLADARHPGSGN